MSVRYLSGDSLPIYLLPKMARSGRRPGPTCRREFGARDEDQLANHPSRSSKLSRQRQEVARNDLVENVDHLLAIPRPEERRVQGERRRRPHPPPPARPALVEVAPKNSSAGRPGAVDVAVGPRAPLFLLSLRHHHLLPPNSSPQVRKCLPLRWRRTEVLSLGGSTTDAEDEEAGSDAESDAPPPRRHRARAPFALLPVDREAAAARAGVDVTTYTAIMEIQVTGRHCHHRRHHHLKILDDSPPRAAPRHHARGLRHAPPPHRLGEAEDAAALGARAARALLRVAAAAPPRHVRCATDVLDLPRVPRARRPLPPAAVPPRLPPRVHRYVARLARRPLPRRRPGHRPVARLSGAARRVCPRRARKLVCLHLHGV